MNISPRENLVMAMSAVWTHRFRSGLTILGIVIGITTVVTVASLLTGLRAGVITFFNELGPDNVFVSRYSGNPRDLQQPLREKKRRPMLPEYAGIIRRFSSTVEDVAISLDRMAGVCGLYWQYIARLPAERSALPSSRARLLRCSRTVGPPVRGGSEHDPR